MSVARPNAVIRRWSVRDAERGDGSVSWLEAWDPLAATRVVPCRVIEPSWSERQSALAREVEVGRVVLVDGPMLASRGVRPAIGDRLAVSHLGAQGIPSAEIEWLIITTIIVVGAGIPGALTGTRLLCAASPQPEAAVQA